MICKTCLTHELKQTPHFIKKAMKEKDYDEVARLAHVMETLEWVLSTDDCKLSVTR